MPEDRARSRRQSSHRERFPLTEDERDGIILAVNSAFRKLRNLYERILPQFVEFGFQAPSAGVVARDLSEKIEKSIVQHCSTFDRGSGHADLGRHGRPWEVKICKGTGLTINQSKQVEGENYIVVNYAANSQVTKIWVLWDATDSCFSPRRSNSNARTVDPTQASAHIELLHQTTRKRRNAKKPSGSAQ